MLIIKIIGIVLCFLLLYFLMKKLNEFTIKKFDYEFFSKDLGLVYIVIYAGIYFGYEWYENALKIGEDTLNGIVVMSISILIFILLLVKNIKNTSFAFGVTFTIIQAILFIPFCIAGLIIILVLIAYFSQTKPVYKVN